MKRILTFIIAACLILSLTACGAPVQSDSSGPAWNTIEKTGSLELKYAQQFSADYYYGGYIMVTLDVSGSYLIVPEGAEIPSSLPDGTTVLRQPMDDIYLVSTSAMDLFRAVDAIENIKFSGTEAEDWYVAEAADAMNRGEIAYAGKYSAPDYELLISGGCDLAIENTMILHSPDVKDELEKLGIPVLIEGSSYESDPMGRMEWIKFYGLLLGKLSEAESYFDSVEAAVAPILQQEKTGKTVAFFYINSAGTANVRKSGDYVPKMIEMAGGEYIFSDLTDGNALSTMNMDMESFFAGAKDSDIIIYNSTIDNELFTMDQLLEKSQLLGKFKAVQDGNVWCTSKSLFQGSMALGDMIRDINAILTNPDTPDSELKYLHKLK